MLDVPVHERSLRKVTINNKVYLSENVEPKEYQKTISRLHLKG